MKKVKSLEKWIVGYKEVKLLVDELELAFDFYKDEMVDTKEFKLGIRTIVIDRTEVTDKNGSGNFCFVVNDTTLVILQP